MNTIGDKGSGSLNMKKLYEGDDSTTETMNATSKSFNSAIKGKEVNIDGNSE